MKKIGLFLGTVAVAACLLDYAVTSGLARTGHGDWGIWNAVFSGAAAADILLSGNSRTVEHIDPETLDAELGTRSWNLGMAGYQFETQYHAYRIYRLYNPPPRLLVQNVDEWEFSPSSDPTGKVQFFSRVRDGRLRAYLAAAGFDRKKLLLPFVRYLNNPRHIAGGLMEFFRLRHFPAERVRGYAPVDAAWDGTNLRDFIRNRKGVLVPAADPRVLALFDEFLAGLREDGVEVVLVASPFYREAAALEPDRPAFMEMVRRAGAKHGFRLLDYGPDPMSEVTENFYGAMHLNKLGSRRFSQKLAKDIKKLGLLERADATSPRPSGPRGTDSRRGG